MKILQIGQLIGGLDIYMRNTIMYSKLDVEYIIVRGSEDNSTPIIRNTLPVKEYVVNMQRRISLLDVVCFYQIFKAVYKERPDVIHCHSAKGGIMGRIIGSIFGIKTFYTPHAFSFLSSQNSSSKRFFIFVEKLTRCNAIVLACSNSEALLAKQIVNYPENRVLVWHNSVPDIKNIVKSADSSDEVILCTVGRPSFQKNTLFLLEVLKEVLKKKPFVQLHILGVGHFSPMLSEVQKYIAENQLGESVTLIPWLQPIEAFSHINKSLIYISTSRYEGLPLSVIEAMALGKPIIASNVVGNKDCVRDGYNGFLVDFNVDLFVEKICTILDDNDLLRHLSFNSRKMYEDDFNISKRIDELTNIYLDYEIPKK